MYVAFVTTPALLVTSLTGLRTPNIPVQFKPSGPKASLKRFARNVNKLDASAGLGEGAGVVNGLSYRTD